MKETTELKVQPKKAVAGPIEHTEAGQIFTPAVDIFETDRAITLLADMPGVNAEQLSVDLRDDTLTLRGEVADESSQDVKPLVVEYFIGHYHRRFNLPEVIDQGKIEAHIKNGVLRLVLPKVEKAAPRKIPVQNG
jgi:HSP20 family molecular chaperone IbpA